MRAKFFIFLISLFGIIYPATALAEASGSSKKNPTSKIFVAEVQGLAEFSDGTKIEALASDAVFDAEGTVIYTDADSRNALVLSNGNGISLAPNTRLEVRQFRQEPFQPQRADLDSEPSVSQNRNYLARGTIGICSGKLIAGSSAFFDTPQGSINLLSQTPQKVVIEVTEEETIVTVFEGVVTVRGPNLAGGENLAPNNQAVIRSRGPGQSPLITLRSVPEARVAELSDLVASACQARSRVFFETVDRINEVDGATSELVPVVVTPARPREAGPIISPARL